MEGRRKPGAFLRVARMEYGRWVTNPRMIILGVFVIFVYTLVIEPLDKMALKSGGTVNMLEPYVAVVNSGLLIMMLPCIFLALMGDFPVIDELSLFYLGRSGKIRWALGQMLFLVLGIVSIVVFVFLSTALPMLKKCELGVNWSETVRFYLKRFPEEAGSFHAGLLPGNLYNQVSLLPALIHSTALLTLYLLLLGLIMFLFRLLRFRMVGLCTCSAIVALGVGTCAVKTSAMWLFPMANTIVWLHFTDIMRKPIRPLWQSYLYFGILILIVLAIDLAVAVKSDFITTGDH